MSVATNPLTYNLYVTQLATMTVVQTQTVGGIVSGVDTGFNNTIPGTLNYAELRVSRDLDLMPSLTSNAYSLTPGNATLSIPVTDFVTVQTVGVSMSGNVTQLIPTTKEFIGAVYPSSSFQQQPQYFAMIGGDQATGGNTFNNILVGPCPDINYPVTIFGTQRLPSLYLNSGNATLASTATTFISSLLPDLLLQASMIYISQFQRNWGPASNDPEMGATYEAQYEQLLKGALVEEARKRFAAGAWSSMGSTPIATATR